MCGILQGSAAIITRLAFSPDGTILAAGGSRGPLTLWETATGQVKAVVAGHSSPTARPSFTEVRDLAFSPDGTRLATVGGDDRCVRLWDVATGRERAVLHGHTHLVFSVAYAPAGDVIASGGIDGTIMLWDTATGRERGTLRGHSVQVSALTFSPDGRSLASVDAGSAIRLWEIEPGT
jgi:WD40 repeat protein